MALSVFLFVRFGAATGAENVGSSAKEQAVFNVLNFGAKGDGATLDTSAINQAIDACAKAGGGQVLIPPGRYLSGTVHLRSRLHLCLADGAVLIGTTNLALYDTPAIPGFMPEAKWGKWHRGLIVGEGVEDVTISGPGVIDGNRVFDPTGEERMRGPHTIVFVGCRRFTLRDLSIVDSANYAVFFQISDDVECRNLKITGGWDGIHFRGAPQQWCHNVTIAGCRFHTGDDSIAGRYWDNVLLSDCIINSSCNGLRVIGPATHLTVQGCDFFGPGQEPHRSSNRTNMLSGIILQPGAWDRTQGVLDQVLITNNTMREVASPITIWTKPGNPVGQVVIFGLKATGVYRSALSFESWSGLPITNVVLRNVQVAFSGGGRLEQANQPVKGPGVDARPLPAWGIYARGMGHLEVQNVQFTLAKPDFRPVVIAEQVQSMEFDSFMYPRNPQAAPPLVMTNSGPVKLRNTDFEVSRPLENIRISADGKRFVSEESGAEFKVWGFNYDHDADNRLLESYWEKEWEKVVGDFGEMKSLGANTARIHLQVSRFMNSEDVVNERSIAQLQKLVKLAESAGLYLDITGLGCYDKTDVPKWYNDLDEVPRWEVQARFWEAVAKACSNSPAIFCYDLMNEPVVTEDKTGRDWTPGAFGDRYFVQRLTLDLKGRTAEQIAKAWVDKMVAAIKKHDRRHLVTVGVIPWAMTWPKAKPLFYSPAVGKNLDFVSVHFYPKKGEVTEALKALAVYDVGKPLIIEEMFPLSCPVSDVDKFIDGSKTIAEGWIGFYWGKTIAEYRADKDGGIAEAMARDWLEYFVRKAPEIRGASHKAGTTAR